MLARALLLSLSVPALIGAAELEAQSSRLGSISFPTSGGDAAQVEFLTGVLWLHSFEYERAASAFRKAQELDREFALAYWGEAMTHTHPIWNEQDIISARAVLSRLGPDAAARLAKAPTPREQRYLEAVHVLYGDGSKPARDTLYSQAMGRLVREFPEDHEAKAFYALSLLGLNQGVRDTATYVRSAPFADTVFRANRHHPGAAHYLIHAFDDPFHAHLGLEAARAYSGIAPDAPHAQHMTTHIFLALGMWEDVVSQNRIAVRLTGEVPGHYSAWLHYGLLQQGRYQEARQFLQRVRDNMPPTARAFTHLSLMRANQLLHSGEWTGEPAEWVLPGERMTPLGRAIDGYRRGSSAFRRRDTAGLAAAAAEAGSLARRFRGESPAAGNTPDAMQLGVIAGELEAMLLFMKGGREAAVRAMREVTAAEDAIPLEFGPPFVVEPSHELLGAMLLDADPPAALQEFECVLTLAPGRAKALQGLIRASVAAGNRETARRALEQLAVVWGQAEPGSKGELERLRRMVDGMQ